MGLQLVSGAAGLAYEMLWTDTLGLSLGHEYVAVLAVLSAYFFGMAVGAHVLGRAVAESPAPARWYALCEGVVAAWALVLEKLLPRASELLAALLGPAPSPAAHWALAFIGTSLALFPATAAMGGALPALARAVAAMGTPRSLPALYAANTMGAVLGVLGCTFVLLPALGHATTARVCGLASGLSALLALHLAREQVVPAYVGRSRAHGTRTLWLLGATGLLGLGYEVLAVRALAQLFENTVYSFAFALAAYLLGTSLGAVLVRRARRLNASALLIPVSACGLLGVACLGHGAWLAAHARAALGALLAADTAALLAEALVACAVFLPITVAMGALFATLCAEAEREGHALGRAFALNTLGAALAPSACSLLLLPAVGLRTALIVTSLGYLPWARVTRTSRWLLPLLPAALFLALLSPSPAHVTLPDGGRLLAYEQGVRANVSVVEDARGVRTLHIDDKVQEGSSHSGLVDGRQAWLPLLLHRAPRRALFLGLGTGITAQSAARDATLRVEAVELLPEVARAAELFMDPAAPRPHVLVADARRYARSGSSLFDVIVADLYHPARAGAASLYTVEHFAALKERLARGGLFCQWLPLHQLDLATLRSIVATFLSVYPEATALLASNSLDTPVLGLVARADGGLHSARDVARRVSAQSDRARAHQLDDEWAVLGSFVAGPAALRRFSDAAALNTDDRPTVAYRAPWLSYAPSEPPRARLDALLGSLSVAPGELVSEARADGVLSARLGAYGAARNRFIALGAPTENTASSDELVRTLRGPLLALLRTSPDFRPAYDLLLQMAGHLAKRDPAAARALLGALEEAQPSRPEAAQYLERLATSSP